MNEKTEKLQKIISAAGLMSRRAAEEYISAGRVSVNGATASLGDRADGERDVILVDGRPLPSAVARKYIMLNKPKGYVTTRSDEQGRKNVTELVTELGCRLYPVGRLDINSEGLLIMTNDGDFANLLMHPSHNFTKTYHTWVLGGDVDKALETLRGPLEIDGCTVKAARAELLEKMKNGALLSISINEGRNRQVRKMCRLAGLYVSRLLRVSEGPLELGRLKSGEWRELTEREITLIRSGKTDEC